MYPVRADRGEGHIVEPPGLEPHLGVPPPDPERPDRRAVVEELSSEIVARGGRVWRRVVSDSMAPMLLPGDRILVERCECAAPPRAGGLRAGDIIVFHAPAGPTAHRVVLVRRRAPTPLVLEKGDANPFATAIAAGAIVGRVCRIERAGRSLDLQRGRGRRAQVVAAYLSLLELAAYTIGRAARRILRLPPTGVAGRLSGALRRLIAHFALLRPPCRPERDASTR